MTYIPLTFLGSIHRRPPSTTLHRAFTFMHTIPPRTMNERLLDIDSHSQQKCLPPPLSITGRFNRYPSAAVKRRTSYTRVCIVSVGKDWHLLRPCWSRMEKPVTLFIKWVLTNYILGIHHIVSVTWNLNTTLFQ